MKPIYSSIPVELCIYGLTKSKINHLKLLVYLKHIASGHIRMDPSLYKCWAVDLQVSERWIRDAIAWMIKQRWITINNRKKSLRIVSYLQICRGLNFKCNLAAKFDGDDFVAFKAFCCAAAMTYWLRRKNWMDKNRRSVSQMADTSKSRNQPQKGFSTLPIRYFAKCMEVSSTTANNFKKLAKSSGYISVKRQINKLTDSGDKPFSKEILVFFKTVADSEACGRLRTGKKYLKIVDSDLIRSNIVCSKKSFKNGEKM